MSVVSWRNLRRASVIMWKRILRAPAIAVILALAPAVVAMGNTELARFPAKSGAKAEYVLRLMNCSRQSDYCKIEVVLFEEGAERSAASLPKDIALPVSRGPMLFSSGSPEYLAYPPHSESQIWHSTDKLKNGQFNDGALQIEVEAIRISA